MSIRSKLSAMLLALFICTSCHAKEVEVHDPVMTKVGDTYYVFSTGPGITYYESKDMVNWKLTGRVFAGQPSWAKGVSSSFNGHIWAPDVYQKNGLIYVYYSVSAFGKNTSAMGVTVNKTLDPSSPDYEWKDQGIVVQSVPNRDDWNAIDPAIIEDEKGDIWMSFGSFWGGLKLVKLDDSLTKVAEPQEWYSLSSRPDHPVGAVEAPYIFKKGEYYYLFVSFDFCCRSIESTYKIMVGRSKSVTGPYLDKDGKDMQQGGGSLVLKGTKDWVALGHNSAYTFDGTDYLVFHAYETADKGLQKLRILPMSWKDGWPNVNSKDLNTRITQLIE